LICIVSVAIRLSIRSSAVLIESSIAPPYSNKCSTNKRSAKARKVLRVLLAIANSTAQDGNQEVDPMPTQSITIPLVISGVDLDEEPTLDLIGAASTT
jgi:hypothetical protein